MELLDHYNFLHSQYVKELARLSVIVMLLDLNQRTADRYIQWLSHMCGGYRSRTDDP